MTEELIKFETAKLAKECGFESNSVHIFYKHYSNSISLTDERDGFFESLNDCLAPTQSLLQKWLRETHNIKVFVLASGDNFTYMILNSGINETQYNTKLNPGVGDGLPLDFKSYEESLEEALYQSLLLVKQNLSTK